MMTPLLWYPDLLFWSFHFQILPKGRLKTKKLHSCLNSNIFLECKANLSYPFWDRSWYVTMMALSHWHVGKSILCCGVCCKHYTNKIILVSLCLLCNYFSVKMLICWVCISFLSWRRCCVPLAWGVVAAAPLLQSNTGCICSYIMQSMVMCVLCTSLKSQPCSRNWKQVLHLTSSSQYLYTDSALEN